MFFFYKILAITFLLFSPIIFAVRIIIGKEDFSRFLEKFCIYKKYNKNQTIWFHGASVGEIMSILPIIKILEKNNITGREILQKKIIDMPEKPGVYRMIGIKKNVLYVG